MGWLPAAGCFQPRESAGGVTRNTRAAWNGWMPSSTTASTSTISTHFATGATTATRSLLGGAPPGVSGLLRSLYRTGNQAVDELLSPLLMLIPMQLLTHHIAAHRGLDVD